MCRANILAAVILGLLAGAACADEKDPTKVPRGPAPKRATLVDVETGDAIFTAAHTIPVTQAVYEEKTVTKDGKTFKVNELTYRTVGKEVRVRYNLSAFEITTLRGDKLTQEEVLK